MIFYFLTAKLSFTLTRVIFKTFLNISEMYRGILFIHSFIQQVFIEQVLSAKHCSKPRRWGYNRISKNPCLCGISILIYCSFLCGFGLKLLFHIFPKNYWCLISDLSFSSCIQLQKKRKPVNAISKLFAILQPF